MIVKNFEEIAYWQLIKEISTYNDKWVDIATTKSEIFINLLNLLDSNSKSILFVNFNPIALVLSKDYDVTVVCDKNLVNMFDFSAVNQVNNLSEITKTFDFVFALDEYFTYAKDEQNQRDLVNVLCSYTHKWLVTTLQDYKNFAPHKKNQIDAMAVNSSNNYIMLENSIADKSDKQLWDHYWYCIKNHDTLLTIGPIQRRTMYFKQLAKYTSDIGSIEYVIQKNLLYKGFFSKNFEHIITVKMQ
jgi:hypothetical protein